MCSQIVVRKKISLNLINRDMHTLQCKSTIQNCNNLLVDYLLQNAQWQIILAYSGREQVR
jgi:hypothetical protein